MEQAATAAINGRRMRFVLVISWEETMTQLKHLTSCLQSKIGYKKNYDL